MVSTEQALSKAIPQRRGLNEQNNQHGIGGYFQWFRWRAQKLQKPLCVGSIPTLLPINQQLASRQSLIPKRLWGKCGNSSMISPFVPRARSSLTGGPFRIFPADVPPTQSADKVDPGHCCSSHPCMPEVVQAKWCNLCYRGHMRGLYLGSIAVQVSPNSWAAACSGARRAGAV